MRVKIKWKGKEKGEKRTIIFLLILFEGGEGLLQGIQNGISS
jgi:hypothetical protein